VSDESAQGFLGRVFGETSLGGQLLEVFALLGYGLEDCLLAKGWIGRLHPDALEVGRAILKEIGRINHRLQVIQADGGKSSEGWQSSNRVATGERKLALRGLMLAKIRNVSQKENMNGKASFLCRLELQLRYRLPATLSHPRAVTFTEDQDVVVAGSHIPLAGLH